MKCTKFLLKGSKQINLDHLFLQIMLLKDRRLNKYVEVYDLEIEDYNNFIANEICVHNSSSNPNLQNVPKRDDDQ